jgi:hypothetical protein
MRKFHFTASVERLVTDKIKLTVEAESDLHAQAIAEGVLHKFPDEHQETEGAVPYCYIESRVNHEPVILSLEEGV